MRHTTNHIRYAIYAALAALMLWGCGAVTTRTVVVTQVVASGSVNLPTVPPPSIRASDICDQITVDDVATTIDNTVGTSQAEENNPPWGAVCTYTFNEQPATVNLGIAPVGSFGEIQSRTGPPTPFTGIGDEAFIASAGSDAPQLWVLVKGKGVVWVAISNEWTDDRALALAHKLLDLLNE